MDVAQMKVRNKNARVKYHGQQLKERIRILLVMLLVHLLFAVQSLGCIELVRHVQLK